MEMLLRYNANIEAKDEDGDTPLLLATACDKSNAVSCLVSQRANVNVLDKTGRTALHIASQKGFISCLKALQCRDIDCNIKDQNGATPLHLAVSFSHTEAVKILVHEFRSDVEVIDNKGRTPLHIAFNQNNVTVEHILSERRFSVKECISSENEGIGSCHKISTTCEFNTKKLERAANQPTFPDVVSPSVVG